MRVLEFIHENEYVHADIKAANLMLGYRDPEQVQQHPMRQSYLSHLIKGVQAFKMNIMCVLQVYLVDYGLSYRYCPAGVHKEYKENPKKGHNGTIEYTSLDAHRGLGKTSEIIQIMIIRVL